MNFLNYAFVNRVLDQAELILVNHHIQPIGIALFLSGCKFVRRQPHIRTGFYFNVTFFSLPNRQDVVPSALFRDVFSLSPFSRFESDNTFNVRALYLYPFFVR